MPFVGADAPSAALGLPGVPTTFTVTVSCNGNIDLPDHNQAAVTFDAHGTPTSDNVIGFGDPGTCTVTETVNGGASTTTYACSGVIPAEKAPVAPAFAPDVSTSGVASTNPCGSVTSTGVTVSIVDPDQTATVTVTNTFVTPLPVPAAEVVVTPALTG